MSKKSTAQKDIEHFSFFKENWSEKYAGELFKYGDMNLLKKKSHKEHLMIVSVTIGNCPEKS